MADASEVYKKSDTMNKMEGEMKRMVEDQKAMIDPNRRDDDSENSSEQSSDEEGSQANEFTFISAIDVGSHFIDINTAHQ
jgi:hypothetical protein